MGIHALDAYRQRDSAIHRLDPRVKLALTGIFVISVALLPEGAWLPYGLLAILALFVAVMSRLGVGFVQRRSAVALPFALAAITIVFSTPGRSVLTVSIFGRDLAVTDRGLTSFSSVLIKSWLSVQVAVVLTASTPFPQLLRAMRDVGFPKVMVTTVGLAYRYIFVIGDEALKMMQARAARSGTAEGNGSMGILWRARVTGRMVGSLFLRSIERSERIYDAMVARGFDGEVRSLQARALRPREALLAIPFALSVLAIAVLARLSR
ncbi:MAG: cobalt ECF transporter T component CbiQ [Anaerolineae bacterium]